MKLKLINIKNSFSDNIYIYDIYDIYALYIIIITVHIPSTRTGRALFFFLTHSFFTERDLRGHGRHLHDSLLWCRGLFLCLDHLGGTSDAFRDLLGDWMLRPWWTWLEIVVIHCRFFLAIVIVNIIYINMPFWARVSSILKTSGFAVASSVAIHLDDWKAAG